MPDTPTDPPSPKDTRSTQSIIRYAGLKMRPRQVLSAITRVSDERVPGEGIQVSEPAKWITGLLDVIDDQDLRARIQEHLLITLRTGTPRQVSVVSQVNHVAQFADMEDLLEAAGHRQANSSPRCMTHIAAAIEAGLDAEWYQYDERLRIFLHTPSARQALLKSWFVHDLMWALGHIRVLLTNDAALASRRATYIISWLPDEVVRDHFLPSVQAALETFETETYAALRTILAAHGISVPPPIPKSPKPERAPPPPPPKPFFRPWPREPRSEATAEDVSRPQGPASLQDYLPAATKTEGKPAVFEQQTKTGRPRLLLGFGDTPRAPAPISQTGDKPELPPVSQTAEPPAPTPSASDETQAPTEPGHLVTESPPTTTHQPTTTPQAAASSTPSTRTLKPSKYARFKRRDK